MDRNDLGLAIDHNLSLVIAINVHGGAAGNNECSIRNGAAGGIHIYNVAIVQEKLTLVIQPHGNSRIIPSSINTSFSSLSRIHLTGNGIQLGNHRAVVGNIGVFDNSNPVALGGVLIDIAAFALVITPFTVMFLAFR